MKPNIIHSMVVCLAAFALPFMVACGSREEFLPDDVAEALLYLNIEPIGETRASTAELPDNERMKSVRVIVLHEDGTVEHNRYFPPENALSQKYIWLKVKPDEKKKIFLFANEESVRTVTAAAGGVSGNYPSLTAFFDSYTEGMSGFEAAVNGLSFTPDYTGGKPIPMSSVYEIDFPEKGNIEKTFYVVRAATKFTVNFYNWRGEDVTVNNLSIASHADRNFLMAHVNSYPDTQNPETNQKYPTWIDWLKAVSDASNVDSDKAIEDFGWLTDYELPAGEGSTSVYRHGEVIVKGASMDKDNPENAEPGKATIVPVFYLPESKNLKPEGATIDGEQEYTLTLDIDGREEPFVCELGKLKALFRNTHVVVNVTLYHHLEATVEVIPFTSVPLNPDYGLEREEFTGYVVGKDGQNRTCWYDGNYYEDLANAVPLYLGPADKPGEFVTINGKEYLLVYADYERTAAKLEYFFKQETRKKYLLTREGITGYKEGNDMYFNKLQQRVWLDFGGDPNGDADAKAIYDALKAVGLDYLKCCRMLYEWDRLNWNQARWWGWKGVYPKYWFDIFGNRYPWSVEETNEDRKAKLGEWVQYLE